MSYMVTADGGANFKINFAPETLVEEVLQNLTMIFSTPKGSVPLDRNFGISTGFVDKPMPIAEAMILSEILDAVEAYEPRATVLNVNFERNAMVGKIIPHIEVDIRTPAK